MFINGQFKIAKEYAEYSWPFDNASIPVIRTLILGGSFNIDKQFLLIKQLLEGFCDLHWCLDLVEDLDCRDLVDYFYGLTLNLVDLFAHKKSKESDTNQKMLEVPAKKC